MNLYKDIVIDYNYEQWRRNRLESVIDFLDNNKFLPDETPTIQKISELEDDNGILKVYFNSRLSDYEKLNIKWIWHDNNELFVKFIKYIQRLESPTFCPYCTKAPQIEDQEINDYLNYLNFNNNI